MASSNNADRHGAIAERTGRLRMLGLGRRRHLAWASSPQPSAAWWAEPRGSRSTRWPTASPGWVLGAVGFFVNGVLGYLRSTARPNVEAAWFAGADSPYANVRNFATAIDRLVTDALLLDAVEGLDSIALRLAEIYDGRCQVSDLQTEDLGRILSEVAWRSGRLLGAVSAETATVVNRPSEDA